MLGRIRGRPKDDEEALEALRRRTAARLAAIVGISSEERPEDDLGPAPDDAEAAETTLPGRPESVADVALIALLEPLASSVAGVEGDPEFDGSPEGAPQPFDAVERVAEPTLTSSPESTPAIPQDDDQLAPEHVAQDGDDRAMHPKAAHEVRSSDELSSPSEKTSATDEGRDRRRVPAVTLPDRIVPVMAPPAEVPELPTDASAPVRGKRGLAAGSARAARGAALPGAAASRPSQARASAPSAKPRRRRASTQLPAACPSCGVLLDEVPAASRRCSACRQRIVVRRVDGRVVLLAEAVAPFFDEHRRRLASGERIKREAGRWLQMAALAGAPPAVLETRARAVAARPLPEAVTSARALYGTTVERAVRAARKSHDWRTVAELRFRQARAYDRASGSSRPVDASIAALHREALDASLRRIREVAAEAELVGGTCCDACRGATDQVVRIATERRSPSLPHETCPAGLCGCRWDVPMSSRPSAKAKRTAAVSTAGRGQGR